METLLIAVLLVCVCYLLARVSRTRQLAEDVRTVVREVQASVAALRQDLSSLSEGIPRDIRSQIQQHHWSFHQDDINVVPECDALPGSFCLGTDWPRENFEARLVEVSRDHRRDVGLYTCRRCGQAWRVDIGDRQEVPLAIKARQEGTWTRREDNDARIEYLLRSHGGEGNEKCVVSGCSARALRSKALCAKHAFRTGARWRTG